MNGADLARYSQVGVVTPDHTIRTKNWPLIVPAPEAGKLDEWKKDVQAAVEAFVARYHDYFDRNNAKSTPKKTELDPLPRVILVPGVGLFGLGASAKDAAIAADIAENTVEVITDAEAIGTIAASPKTTCSKWNTGRSNRRSWARRPRSRWRGRSRWSPAAARASVRRPRKRWRAQARKWPCSIATAPRRPRLRAKIGEDARHRLRRDRSPKACARHSTKSPSGFGGVDIVVSNAGAAWQGTIGTVDDETLRQSFELNFFAHQTVAQHAVRIMQAQGTGGCLLFNTSKQAVNPGKDFGPYGLPKAATLFLVKQYALDHGKDGIRANAVNADRIRSGLLTDDMVASRSKARGVSATDYMSSQPARSRSDRRGRRRRVRLSRHRDEDDSRRRHRRRRQY